MHTVRCLTDADCLGARLYVRLNKELPIVAVLNVFPHSFAIYCRLWRKTCVQADVVDPKTECFHGVTR